MEHMLNQRNLRAAVERLARTNVSEADVSCAIDCFGQVLADLTDTPLRLAVVTGSALETENALRAKVANLEANARLHKLAMDAACGEIELLKLPVAATAAMMDAGWMASPSSDNESGDFAAVWSAMVQAWLKECEQ